MESSERKLTWFVVVATVAVFLGLIVRNASAGDPVPGIDISLEQIPGGIVTKGVTGADGVARFPGLAPGTYRVVLNNIAKATSPGHKTVEELKNAPPSPEPDTKGSGSGPSVNIGIGGIFGSGSTKRSPSEGADGGGKSENRGIGGGIGINIPLSSDEVWNQPSKAEADVGIKEEGVKRAPGGEDGQAMSCDKCIKTCTDGRCVQSSGGCFCYRTLPQAQRKAQEQEAEADVTPRQYRDAGSGPILWITLVTKKTALFIPRSACDIKDGTEAVLVIVDNEPQFAVRISQTPYLPQGNTIKCTSSSLEGGGDPLKGLNIRTGGGSTGGQLCP